LGITLVTRSTGIAPTAWAPSTKTETLYLWQISVILLINSSCDKKDNDDENDNDNDTISPGVFNNAHQGQLLLLFSNTFPEFSETAIVDVHIDKEGNMEFSSGGLQYSAEDDNGQSKIKREGELIIMPNGNYFLQDDNVFLAVDENTMLTEKMTVWYWDGSSWQLALDESISEAWNGGLVFSLDDAVVEGSIVEATTQNGTVKWTLILTPIP